MYLLDTCVFSELIKPKPFKSLSEWILNHDEESFYVSALTFGEIKKGIEKTSDMTLKKKLNVWFHDLLIPRFWNRLLVIDGSVALVWGELVAKSEKKGRPLPSIDSLIAATAIAHNLSIVTRNVKDFKDLKISIINPWET